MAYLRAPFPPKKSLGQHFLSDNTVAKRVVGTLIASPPCKAIIEIGPGTGALTHWLVASTKLPVHLVEIDKPLAQLLHTHCQTYAHVHIHNVDFLQWPLSTASKEAVAIIGSFPYNISSPLFFKILAHKQQVLEVVAIVQQEVATRLAARPGNKTYGILSVLLQAFYEVTYCFTIPAQAFSPPPKVTSAAIRLVRNQVINLACDESYFLQVVKSAFQQRRKTLRNALKMLGRPLDKVPPALLTQRAEALSVDEFVALTKALR